MSNAPSNTRRDVLLVTLVAFAFATSGPLGKVANDVPPVIIACARTGIAAVILALVAPRVLRASVRALNGKQRLALVLAGALLAGHFALFFAGLAATSLAAAVALVSLEPLAVVLTAFVAFGIRPLRRELAGLGIATLGAVVVASGAGSGEHRLAGDLLVLGAVALYGAYVASARGLRDALPPLAYSTVVFGTSSLLLLPFAIVLARALPADVPSSRGILAVIAMGLVPTLIGHTLVQRVARRAPPAIVALASPGETVGSLLIGALVLGSAPSAREMVGAAFVLVGATLAVTARREPTAPIPEP